MIILPHLILVLLLAHADDVAGTPLHHHRSCPTIGSGTIPGLQDFLLHVIHGSINYSSGLLPSVVVSDAIVVLPSGHMCLSILHAPR